MTVAVGEFVAPTVATVTVAAAVPGGGSSAAFVVIAATMCAGPVPDVGLRESHGAFEDAVQVTVVEDLGSDAYVYGRTTIGGRLQQIVSRGDWRNPPQKGERVNLRVDPEKAHIFATTDGRRLG